MDGIAIVRLALSVVTEKLLAILALALVFTLACWTMYDPRWERLATMAFFSIFSYLLMNRSMPNAIEKTAASSRIESADS
jgi:hypothetical protein